MKRILLTVATIIVFAFSLSACSISHHVHEDYPEYLENNTGESKLPHSSGNYNYTATSETEQHRYEFRSAMVGYGNLWIVEFGKILDQTIKSKDVQKAFGKLEKQTNGDTNNDSLLIFDLINYTFNDFGAHVKLQITLKESGVEQFEKTYQADGKTQGAKMFWAGVFGMKNAIQQSTKHALDDIFKRLINDINESAKKDG